jgi:transposase-like protein
VLNVLDALPKRLWPQARRRLAEIVQAETRADCERLRDLYVAELRAQGQSKAAETLLRDWDAFVTFYHYPKEHWLHRRTSNPLESVFSGVRLRTNVPSGCASGRTRCTWSSKSSSA